MKQKSSYLKHHSEMANNIFLILKDLSNRLLLLF